MKLVRDIFEGYSSTALMIRIGLGSTMGKEVGQSMTAAYTGRDCIIQWIFDYLQALPQSFGSAIASFLR